MKIILPGGSGQVGQILARAFSAAGNEIVILTRNPEKSIASNSNKFKTILWDAKNPGPWTTEIDGSDVVINLAGRSVNCRYNSKNRRLIINSRVNSTRAIGLAIAKASKPPRLWLQSSTATIYSHRFDAPNDDLTGILGGNEPNAPEKWRFSIEVAKGWEQAAMDMENPRTRKVLLRSAMIMSPDCGGIFDVLLNLVRHGLGGTAGSGRQYISWIHDADFIAAINFLINREDLSGPINLSSPNPLPNEEFMHTLRRAWGTKIGLPATKWMLEIGTFLLRTESELVLKSRRVIPTRLLQSGFQFAFSNWQSAAEDLCRRWHAR